MGVIMFNKEINNPENLYSPNRNRCKSFTLVVLLIPTEF